MAGGPILPSSIYVGGASGNLSPSFYISGAGSGTLGTAQSPIEGVAVAGSLAVDGAAVFQFNLPESLPTGTLKARLLFWANASTGNAIYTIQDGGTPAGSNIGNATLATDASAVSVTRTAVDIAQEIKVTLTGANVAANNLFTVVVTFNHTSWTLAVQSVWQVSLVWE